MFANGDDRWMFEFSLHRDSVKAFFDTFGHSDLTQAVDCCDVILNADRDGKQTQTLPTGDFQHRISANSPFTMGVRLRSLNH